jgi:LEA14-like dessication related protein
MISRRAAVTLALAALSGCAGLGNALREPDIRLDRVIVRDIGIRGGKLDLEVEVANPNGFDLRGTELALGLDVEGSHLGDVRISDEFTVDRNGSTSLTLPLQFEWAGVGGALRTALSQGEIPYEMKGELSLQTPWGAHSVPFTKTGRAPLTNLVGVPAVGTSR